MAKLTVGIIKVGLTKQETGQGSLDQTGYEVGLRSGLCMMALYHYRYQ